MTIPINFVCFFLTTENGLTLEKVSQDYGVDISESQMYVYLQHCFSMEIFRNFLLKFFLCPTATDII